MDQLSRTYEPQEFEKRIYQFWEAGGWFAPPEDESLARFSIVIPPPNITGSLHMGHALQYTLHDIVTRWKRMRGHAALWLPGTDHAGIGTQMVVERQLHSEKTSRKEIGREKFLERVWQWKEQYGGRITQQLRGFGSSCDWSRERFTMDPGLSRTVRTVFVSLFKEGLIYRGEYIVNWCPRCQTALSDLEVISRETAGKLYHVKYPLKGSRDYVVVATTRPETMLGDTAVAIHPDDDRASRLKDSVVVLPIMGREIPVIEDEFVDREFGTGLVKVTPAHDPNDFEVGRRHGLAEITVMDGTGKMNENAGAYAGKDRFQARKEIVQELRKKKLLVKIDDHTHAVGHCQRCDTIVEPTLSKQWFVRTKPLADAAKAAVVDGRIRIIPEIWSKIYYDWMDNIRDWCISRQLWWGHRIPVWYCDDCGEVTCEVTDPPACRCGSTRIRQDDDVLDTWFSSALWPFSTLGWREQSRDFRRFYPTDVLITGYDIIFFWVARMIMMGLKFTGEVPFREVFLTGLVRDASGQKMSKSKGNTIEPDQLMSEYGTDAMRFALAIQSVPGTDIPLHPGRMKGYRAFANKLWNATRFVIMNLPEDLDEELTGELTFADRWIEARLGQVAAQVNAAMSLYKFYEAADTLYHFLWHEFCDWYIELIKPRLTSGQATVSTVVLLKSLRSVLKLLHPFMPYVTEELYQKLPHCEPALIVAAYPPGGVDQAGEQIIAEMKTLQAVVTSVRNMRSENSIDPARKIDLILASQLDASRAFLEQRHDDLCTLTRSKSLTVGRAHAGEKGCLRGVVGDIEISIPITDFADIEAEKNRIQKEIQKAEQEITNLNRRLSNHDFLEKAPEKVVREAEQRQKDVVARREKLETLLRRLA
ncbi:MAG: valine--tRNA ligase [Acidobacteria bacterium]|nr:valine--tRNA ligase [Acidobacteriota bacterium]